MRDRDDEMMPSRADEVDDWGAERKFVPSDRQEPSRGFGGGFREGGFREGGFREGGFREGGFREGGFREGGFREGGFREGGFREGGFGDGDRRGPPRDREPREPSRADTVDDWGANRPAPRFDDRERREPRELREPRPPSRADEVDRWGPRKAEDDGGERRERPRLKLKPRSKPLGDGAERAGDASIFGEAKPVSTNEASDVAKDVEEKLRVEEA